MERRIQLKSTSSAEEIRDSISQAVKTDKIVLFTKERCSFCKEAKELFKAKNQEYSVVELDKHKNEGDIQEVLDDMTGARTVPRVFINGSCIGGCSETKKLHSAGSLDALLKK